jgi:catechol 2,3-dioxygenase-like lactoylglutathione lyase family enzyme
MPAANVRYIVDDVDRALEFYGRLGFAVLNRPAPEFAMLARGELGLLLSVPGVGGGGQAMPDGRLPEPGGWNRMQIVVEKLDDAVAELRAAGVRFRNDVVEGRGGRQILAEDPAGNPVELFQPA